MTAQPSATGSPAPAADRAGQSDTLENLARVGLTAYGVIHVLVAWLALQIAWGGGGQEADQSGAMATIARQPFGKPLLWIVALGLLALAVWQLAEILRVRSGLTGSGREKKKALQKAAKSVSKAVVYVVLAVTALKFALGSGQSSAQQQQQKTAGVFGWPGGRFLVVVVAVVLVIVGGYHVYKGFSDRFLKQIDLAQASHRARTVITWLGRVGFPGKGVALAVAGCLFGYAAITYDPSKARGLDGAIHTLADAPFGAVLLTLVALGILAFGAFLLARARYPERT
jgi:hypothetical protein